MLPAHRGEARATGSKAFEFVEGFRKELNEIQSPLVRKMFVLSKASRLMHLRLGEYTALIAAADTHQQLDDLAPLRPRAMPTLKLGGDTR